MACLFNLSADPVTLTVQGQLAPAAPTQAAMLAGESLTLGALGFAFVVATGATPLRIKMP
jgi:hypothetical protein